MWNDFDTHKHKCVRTHTMRVLKKYKNWKERKMIVLWGHRCRLDWMCLFLALWTIFMQIYANPPPRRLSKIQITPVNPTQPQLPPTSNLIESCGSEAQKEPADIFDLVQNIQTSPLSVTATLPKADEWITLKSSVIKNFSLFISCDEHQHRELRCLRNTIHCNLFITYIFSALLWLLTLSFQVSSISFHVCIYSFICANFVKTICHRHDTAYTCTIQFKTFLFFISQFFCCRCSRSSSAAHCVM